MSGFYVGIAKCGCERAWLVDDDETTPKEIAEFARRQQQTKRSMKHVERMNLEPAPDCTEHKAIAEALKRMAPDDYKPMPDRPVPMEKEEE